MPLYQLLTDRTLAEASAITPTTLIHIVTTADTRQNPAGSSYKAELGQLAGLFSGGSDTLVTGGTYSAGTITFTNNSGGTFNVSGLTEPFTGGTVSGATIFTNGLSANTISATTYQNLPISGTHNYISKFSSGSTILVDSQLRDDGSTVGIGLPPNVNAKLFVLTSSEPYGLAGQNQGTNGIGVYGQALALGNTTGVFGLANGTSTSNIGVNGQANDATTNIGLRGYAFGGANNYSVQLLDGTEGVGKVLTSVTSDGKANWQTLPSFTGGTVSGNTNFTNGLTANTISATTYYNLPQKEIFYKSSGPNSDMFGFFYEPFCDGGTDPVYINGVIPNDFSTMVSCDLITIPTFSGNVLTDIKISYGQTGTIFSGNDISTNITYTYEIDEFTNLNVLPVFSSVTVNDIFSLNVFQNDARLYVLGLKMKYNRI